MALFVCVILLVCALHICGAFYLPGLAPVNYCPTADEATCPVRSAIFE